MTTNQSAALLDYSKVQIVAEGMFGFAHVDAPAATRTGTIQDEWLTQGNDHSSRLTDADIKEFKNNWDLVEHIANTATGFSGTLLKCKVDDPSKGLTAGQLVISFRSTEFIEDSVRDNQATNTLELSAFGWAFGQIADMQKWYADLKTRYAPAFAASNNQVDVTGYSLGGSLATTFNPLFPSDIRKTYTFNGAGVGLVNNQASTVAATGPALTALMSQFKDWRDNGSSSFFTDSDAHYKYAILKDKYAIGSGYTITAAMAQRDADEIKSMRMGLATDPVTGLTYYPPTTRNNELGMIQEALERIASIASIAETVRHRERCGEQSDR